MENPPPNSSQILAEQNYIRARCNPAFRDLNFLCLTDLREIVQKTAPKMGGKLFDYGCGGAPYQGYFTSCSDYIRADVLPATNVDRVLQLDGLTAEPSEHYNAILSSQVLEHVPDAGGYVRECSRILKTGGMILLTTHGMFPEHKCPHDYYRWTSEGVEKLLQSHGFEVLESTKLTCGVRGGIQLLHYIVEQFRHHPPSFAQWVLRILRKAYMVVALPLLNAIGNCYLRNCALLPSSSPEHIYIGVGVLARKR
jgi:SAM-dependent methyltransferase